MSQTKETSTSRNCRRFTQPAAAIDIGATMHVAAVGPHRDEQTGPDAPNLYRRPATAGGLVRPLRDQDDRHGVDWGLFPVFEIVAGLRAYKEAH
jgi:hypothetical protein